MPSLDQLQMFINAADSGSFSAAARRLGKGQSAVSLGIANLEIDLGVELFDRATRKPQLTREGERLLGFARAVVQQALDLEIAASALMQGAETRIRLAVDDAILLPSLARRLKEFGQKFPATQIELVSAVSPEIPDLISSDELDIGLMFSGLKVQTGLEQVFIGNLPFVSVCRPDYPLAGLPALGASDLLSHRQLLLRGVQGSVLEQFPTLSPDFWYASSFFAIREMVLEGIGWAYLPEHIAKEHVATGKLSRLDLRFEHKRWSPPIECIVKKNGRMGPAVRWLWEELKAILD